MARTFSLYSISGNGTYDGRYLKLECTQETNIATNQSTIYWTLTSTGGNSKFYSIQPTTVTINGVQVYYKGYTGWTSEEFPAATGSYSDNIVIDHNNDGSKTIDVSLTTGVYYGATSTFADTWTLNSIPRKAEITSASNFLTDVGYPTISFNNPGGFPMDVWLEPNPIGDHICVRTGIPNTGSYTWELTAAEREVLRSKCSGNSCTIRLGLYSYIGGVQYADYRDIPFTMTENDYTKPSVSVSVAVDNRQLPSVFGNLIIPGKSKLNVSLSATGKHGASISSRWCNVWCSNKDYKTTYWGNSFTVYAEKEAGSMAFVGYAEDSRGFTGSDSVTVSLELYSKPYVSHITGQNEILCYRSNSNGVRTGDSTSVWIKAARAYYTVQGKNNCELLWRRKRANEAWNDSTHQWKVLLPWNGAENEYNAMLAGEVFDLDKAYTIQLKAIDGLGEYDIKTLDVPTRDVALHLGAGGKNVSIGSYCDLSEPYTFHSEWKAIFDKDVIFGYSGLPIVNHVVEEGTDDIWTYRKWADGKAECWGVQTQKNVVISNAWGSLYESAGYTVALPSGLFVDTPVFNISLIGNGGIMLQTYSLGSKTESPHLCAVKPVPVPQGIDTINTSIIAYGRWK